MITIRVSKKFVVYNFFLPGGVGFAKRKYVSIWTLKTLNNFPTKQNNGHVHEWKNPSNNNKRISFLSWHQFQEVLNKIQTNINGLIPLERLNLSFGTYKVKCKKNCYCNNKWKGCKLTDSHLTNALMGCYVSFYSDFTLLF